MFGGRVGALRVGSELQRALQARTVALLHGLAHPGDEFGGIGFFDAVPGAELVPMGFGTFGPGPEAEELDPDLMLVPLAVAVPWLAAVATATELAVPVMARLIGLFVLLALTSAVTALACGAAWALSTVMV